jgi:large subunit ribosomal protein L30
MTEKKATTAAPKADKKPAAKKAAAPKAAAPKKATATKATGGTVTIKRTRGNSGRTPEQLATMTGLGLNKIGRVRTLEDTPAIRGMMRKVAHMIEIVDAA